MNDEVLICVAPVPGEKQEEKFPGRLDVVAELIRCHDAGAAIGHLHARDENHLQSVDPALFALQTSAVRAASPLIIEGSTGGAPEHTLPQRCITFTVEGVELGSLNLGSVNMFDGVYQNKYEDICFYAEQLRRHGVRPTMVVFDLSHLANFRRLEAEGRVQPPYLFELVFDVPNALPYSQRYLELLVEELPRGSQWFCVRHHQHGAADLRSVIELGGHVRVGFEDSPFLSGGRRATSNAALVTDAVEQIERAGRKAVSPARARELLGLAARKSQPAQSS